MKMFCEIVIVVRRQTGNIVQNDVLCVVTRLFQISRTSFGTEHLYYEHHNNLPMATHEWVSDTFVVVIY